MSNNKQPQQQQTGPYSCGKPGCWGCAKPDMVKTHDQAVKEAHYFDNWTHEQLAAKKKEMLDKGRLNWDMEDYRFAFCCKCARFKNYKYTPEEVKGWDEHDAEIEMLRKYQEEMEQSLLFNDPPGK